MCFEKRFNVTNRRDKGMRQIGVPRVADHDEKANPMPDDSLFLIRGVADAAIVRDRNPTAASNLCEPFFVFRVVLEMISVSLDRQPAFGEYFGETQTEVAIGEID